MSCPGIPVKQHISQSTNAIGSHRRDMTSLSWLIEAYYFIHNLTLSTLIACTAWGDGIVAFYIVYSPPCMGCWHCCFFLHCLLTTLHGVLALLFFSTLLTHHLAWGDGIVAFYIAYSPPCLGCWHCCFFLHCLLTTLPGVMALLFFSTLFTHHLAWGACIVDTGIVGCTFLAVLLLLPADQHLDLVLQQPHPLSHRG